MNVASIQASPEKPAQPYLLLLPDPEPWPDPVDGQALLNDLAALFKRFIILPPLAEDALALWTLHTHAFKLRDVTAYLGLESPEKRCGKTTLLGLLSRLVHRPVVAANISPPAFYRVIEEVQPTLLIDEADTFVRGNDKLHGILNAGYSRATAFVVRVGPQRPSDEKAPLRTFCCWCPKAMAAIGRLPETLADRCIVIAMQRKSPAENCDRLRQLDASDFGRKAARFILDNQHAISQARPELPPELNDRAADIWEPLFALADLAGGDWPQKARNAALKLTDCASEISPIAGLFLTISAVFALKKTDQLCSSTLVEVLNDLPHHLWRSLTRGQDLTDRWLAKLLRPYDVYPVVLSINGHRSRGYRHDDFLEPARRYISLSQVEAFVAELQGAPDDSPDATEETAASPGPESRESRKLQRTLAFLKRLERDERERMKAEAKAVSRTS
jgi:hypothetical protein